jgi:hypothetical protein
MNYIVYGQRLTNRDPILDWKTGKMIDDGSNPPTILNTTSDKHAAEFFMENMLTNTKRRQWKIWLEEKP